MLRKVQPLNFVLRRNAQTHQFVHDEQDRESADNSQNPGNRHAGQLIQELMRIAFDEARGNHISIGILQYGIHGADRENSRKNCSDRSADSVNPERVQ